MDVTFAGSLLSGARYFRKFTVLFNLVSETFTLAWERPAHKARVKVLGTRLGVISFIGRCGGLMVIRWILDLAVCSLRNRHVR